MMTAKAVTVMRRCAQDEVAAHTYDGERGVGTYNSGIVGRRTRIHPSILKRHVDNEEYIIIWHHVHPSLTGRREVKPAVFLPRHLR